MQVILFSTDPKECGVCSEAEKKFKQVFAEELKSEEAAIVRIDESEKAQEIWATHGLPLAPVVVITTDEGKVLDSWETGEIPEFNNPIIEDKSEKAEPATAGAPIDKPS